MIESFSICCYWGARPDTVETCTEYVNQTLQSLINTNSPFFQQWYEKAYFRNDALQKKVEVDYKHLLPILKKGKNKKFDHLGIVTGFWNGYPDGEITSIRFTCGSSSNRVPNSVVINLPYEGKAAVELIQYPILKNTITSLIEIWNPERAVIQPSLADSKVTFTTPFLEIGWMTYFSKEYQESHLVRHPCFDEKMEGYGDFLITTKELFSSDNPSHIARLQEYVNQTEFKI